MDKIKTVKIKNPDGSVSEETYTISVDAKDVDMKNGKDLQDTIGDINVDRDGSIAEQLGKYKDYSSDIETLYSDVGNLETVDAELENDIINLQINKINKNDIVDNLESTSTKKVLSAKQGKVLKDLVDENTTNISANTTNINNEISTRQNADTNLQDQIIGLAQLMDVSKRKYVFVGDSYSVGWTPDGTVKSWTEFCKDYLGLSNNQYILLGKGGASFGSNVNSFTMLVNNATADNDVTDVVCCGGYNEIGQTKENTLAGILSFKNACTTKYPNAKIHIGFIGNTTDKTQKANIAARCQTYVDGCAMYNMNYLNNVEFSLHRYYEDFASDGIHPNATGEEHIAWYVTQALRTGSANVIISNTSLVPYESGGGLWHFQTNVRNAVTTLLNIANTNFTYTSETLPAFALTGSTAIDLFTIEDGNINGSGIYSSRGLIPNVLITFEDNTYCVQTGCPFEIIDNKFKLYPCVLNASATNFLTKQIKAITVRSFTYVFSTLDV